jgi:glycosyltransferase involved in cell wall biosynthesis
VVVYAPFAGPLYAGDGAAGGAELQAVTIARSLAGAGLRVRHVVAPPAAATAVGGVEVIELEPGYAEGGLRRRRAVFRTLRNADGAVYLQRSAGVDTGFVGAFARLTRRRGVFSASSDGDFVTNRADLADIGSGLDDRRIQLLYRLGLVAMHAVVAQTNQQAELARRSFGLEPVVIPNICAPVGRRKEVGEHVLWIGSLTTVKDPLAYVELAERLPEIPFVMVAHDHPTRCRELAAAVRARAARIPNLHLLPRRPLGELSALYARAVAVVNTSRFEGFPNTFLEGWARAVPVVSLRIDPDGVISRYGMGVAAGGSIALAANGLRRYFEDEAAASAAGEAGYRYVEQTHTPEVVTPSWLALVDRLLARRVGP